MLRTTLPRTTIILCPLRAAFSTTARAMAQGDTGAPPKMGGQGDAFQRREKASEDYAIRERERERAAEMRKQIAEQRAHLDRLSKHLDELTKESEEENKGEEKK